MVSVEELESKGVFLRSSSSLHCWSDFYRYDGEEYEVIVVYGSDNLEVRKVAPAIDFDKLIRRINEPDFSI